MKGTQAISVTLLMSFLVLATRGKDVSYRMQEEDSTQILTYQGVNKTIQMEDGDVYDCIDVYKQPAFNHPLLKDHKIQMKPRSFPVWKDTQTFPSDSFSQVQPSIIKCPTGTIPILRSNASSTIATHNIDGLKNDMQWERAGLRYIGDLFGARALINVWEPKVNKGSQDSSALWINIENGRGQHTDRMGAGLRVSPTLSRDAFVRFHVAWYDGYSKKSCIDFNCPGYVQVHHNVAPGSRIQPSSIYGGVQKVVDVQIFKEPTSGHWWVSVNKIPIGYWPGGLFKFIRYKGDFAFWGGQVEGPTAASNSPQMGSGQFASEGFRKAAFMEGIEIADDKGWFVTPDISRVKHGSSDRSKYTADGFEVTKDLGMRIFYGGPGSKRA
ncbi:uncharacterized protein [Triticum aestivum]|uniref:Neprosin PEP catalytic domain-containing protein n=1 Tax=Triticum turgidum subsp. durum TaxID=4567 RepID=A0A9R0YVN1_TRITD|nr:uncharacterized protein LOC123134800 [Triticum aestivum]VAI62180.1 unnamed protein product [Triticum turgidum subsp. durum]